MNTDEVIAAAVYTGRDSKIQMNSSEAPSKFSLIDKMVNKSILIIFATLMAMCTISTILHALRLEDLRECVSFPRPCTNVVYICFSLFVRVLDFLLVVREILE